MFQMLESVCDRDRFVWKISLSLSFFHSLTHSPFICFFSVGSIGKSGTIFFSQGGYHISVLGTSVCMQIVLVTVKAKSDS